MKHIFKDGCAWTCLLTLIVLVALAIGGGHALLAVLRFILEGLNSFGAGH
jgi:uncharacterized membrane-anchored protein